MAIKLTSIGKRPKQDGIDGVPVRLGQVVEYEIAFDPTGELHLVAYETGASGGVSTGYTIEGFGQKVSGGSSVTMFVKGAKRGEKFTVTLTSRSKTPPKSPRQGVVIYGPTPRGR